MIPSHNRVRKLVPVTVTEPPEGVYSPVPPGTKGWVDGWFCYVTGDAPPFEVPTRAGAHAARVRKSGTFNGFHQNYPNEPLTEWFFININQLEFEDE